MALTPFSLLLRSPEEAGPAHCSAEGLPACPREWLPLGEPSRAHRPRAALVLPVGQCDFASSWHSELGFWGDCVHGQRGPTPGGMAELGKGQYVSTAGHVGCCWVFRVCGAGAGRAGMAQTQEQGMDMGTPRGHGDSTTGDKRLSRARCWRLTGPGCCLDIVTGGWHQWGRLSWGESGIPGPTQCCL